MTIPYCVLANFQLHRIENILENSNLCLSQIPITSHGKHSKTIPNCFLAIFQSIRIEINLRQFQIES